MNRVRRRIERSGFFLFFFAFFLLALGVAQDITILRNIGFAILALILLVIITRSARDVMRPRRRTPVETGDEGAARGTGTRANQRPAAHDPDNY